MCSRLEQVIPLSLGSKASVDGLEGVLYVTQPSLDKYTEVKGLLEIIAKQYACCNSLVLLIEDNNVQTECASTISLLVLQPPGANTSVDYEVRAQWVQIECYLVSLFVADLGEIKCSLLQEEVEPLGFCEPYRPWVSGLINQYVIVANYQFGCDDDFESVLNAARDWLVAIKCCKTLSLRVLYFVNYDDSSVTFLYFFQDTASLEAFRSFQCCYVKKIVQCNCPDITIDGIAWKLGATIYKNQLDQVTAIFDSCNSDCTVEPCLYEDPFSSCCPQLLTTQPTQRAAVRSAPVYSHPQASVAPRGRSCCGGRR